jgi:hypothetical protein
MKTLFAKILNGSLVTSGLTLPIFQSQSTERQITSFYLLMAGFRRRRFTEDEDQRLRQAVAEIGTGDWARVLTRSGLERSTRQIRERWCSYLDPQAAASFTAGDDATLLQLYDQMPNRWAAIANRMGRRPGAVRSRWRFLDRARARRLRPLYEEMTAGTAPTADGGNPAPDDSSDSSWEDWVVD